MTDFADARTRMVDSQLRPNAVTNSAVLSVMGQIAREQFVPASKRNLAYLDKDIVVAETANGPRHLMAPMYFARLIQLAEINHGDLVLDVGCATGYSTAVIARLADSVVALDDDPALVALASENLSTLGIDNAVTVEGPLIDGYRNEGPYDVIVVNGLVDEIPEALSSQLREGGRLVAVLRDDGLGRGTIFRKLHGRLDGAILFDAAVAPLKSFSQAPSFVF